MSNQPQQYRQGDVLLVPCSVSTMPKVGRGKTRKSIANGILAYGEESGHTHAIAPADLEAGKAELYNVGKDMFLSVTDGGGVSIQHQEHGVIHVPKGDYQVRIQREFTPAAIVSVRD